MIQNLLGNFIKKNKPQFQKYKKYLQANDWSSTSIDHLLTDTFFADLYSGDENKVKKAEISKLVKEQIAAQKQHIQFKTQEFKLQNDMMSDILERIKYLAKKTEGDHHKKEFKAFIKECLSIIEIHTDRTDDYVDSFDLSKIENQEVRTEEMAFIRLCFSGMTKIQDKITELNIKDENIDTSGIEFLNGTKAPLSMHKILVELYPEIGRVLKEKKIDFESDPGNDLHIHNPNPPVWEDKHYWEQDTKTLQYYVNEFKKLEDGIVIDGYYISGWMYYHINVFVTPIPHKVWNEKSKRFESKDKIVNPPLRDSDVIIFETHEKQRLNNVLFMFIAATRRAAKTTLESSKLSHAATIGKKELLCAGGSTKDLNQIAKNFKTDVQYKNAAFAVYNVSNDWKDMVIMGLKTKANKTITLSILYIINTDSGNNVEILAGFTPDEFVYDEAMKAKFLEALQGLKPALKGTEGMIRCFGLLSGTGGDEELSKDGFTVLSDPESNDVLPMDWEMLERGVPEDCITWLEDKPKPFGTFIPGQMCVDMPKYESTLADYVGIKNSKGLSKIKIKITDWKNATQKITENRKKVEGNRVAHNKEVVYMPIKPSEIFLSGKLNPFPVEEAKAHKQYLVETGKWDRRRELYRDTNGNIRSEISTKPLAEYPHKGGTIDAPFLIFEDLPEVKPPMYMYTAGFDDYKVDDAQTSSLGSFVVWKTEQPGDKFSKKIVASIATRPERHPKLHEKWLLLMEAYNLSETCFGENIDYAIKDYLDTRHLADKYLAPSLAFTQTFNIPNNLKRTTGWNPTTSKKILFGLFLAYCNEDFEEIDENGKTIILKGVQRIDDIGILDEIINYKEDGNWDKIVSAMGGYAYLHYLVSSYKLPKLVSRRQNQEEQPEIKKPSRRANLYTDSSRRGGMYNKRR